MARLPQQSTLETRLAELERRMRIQETASRLRSASVGEGGLRFYGGGGATFEDGGGIDIRDGGNLNVDGSAAVGGTLQSKDFDGDLNARNAGTTGWAFDRARAAIGDLLLRPGSIGNDALANPVKPDTASVRVSNMPITGGAFGVVGEVVKPVPAGFTGLLVNVTGWVFARNPHTTGGVDGKGTDGLSCYVRVSGSDGDDTADPYASGISGFGGFTTASAGVAAYKQGLQPGSSVTLRVYAAATFQTLPANTENKAALAATLLWIR